MMKKFENTGVMHDEVLKGLLLTLTAPKGLLSATRCEWPSACGMYRIVYTTKDGDKDVPPRYQALRRRLSGHGEYYWDHAIPVGESRPRKKHTSSIYHPTVLSALKSLDACYEQDLIAGRIQDKIDALVSRETVRIKKALAAKRKAAAMLLAGVKTDKHKAAVEKAENKAKKEAAKTEKKVKKVVKKARKARKTAIKAKKTAAKAKSTAAKAKAKPAVTKKSTPQKRKVNKPPTAAAKKRAA